MNSDENDFLALIDRVRRGDEEAARELVTAYEPHVRRIIRIRMTDARIRRAMDSMDVCQSVMADFFVRTALGQFEFETPEDLIKLLATMARNRLTNAVNREQAQRRDTRRLGTASLDDIPLAAADETPSQVVAGRELLQKCRDRLTAEEMELADCRAAGEGWNEISDRLGMPADMLRMRLTRAMDRVAREVGIGE